jgi:phytoene dehydrogenase-like protein
MTSTLTIVGGGIAGLTAAITAAEAGWQVELHERGERLGGRAWTSDAPFKANWGPHVIYADGPWWRWLSDRKLTQGASRLPVTGTIKFRIDGTMRRLPPLAMLVSLRRLRRAASAPADQTFREWASQLVDETHAKAITSFMGVVTFDHDPGRLSAAFVHERLIRATPPIPTVRYIPGGWATLIERLAAHATNLGVTIATRSPVDRLPNGPVVLAVPMNVAATLTNDPTLHTTGTRTAILDLGLSGKAKPPFIVSDFDEPGWIETFSCADPTLAPKGQHLVQCQKGMRPDETLDDATNRIETLLDTAAPQWRDAILWRRRAKLVDVTGALDLPGITWNDRPTIERSNGVYLANDSVAQPGLLTEVSFNAAIASVHALNTRRRTLSAR